MTDEKLIKNLRARTFLKGSIEELAADRIEQLVKDRKFILDERDRTFALMLARAEVAEAKLAKLAINTRIFHINAEALSEIKAVVDGQSEQSIKAIIYGLLAELEETE